MSDTPRTDAAIVGQSSAFNRKGESGYMTLVDVNFARQLERELNEAKKNTARLDWLEKQEVEVSTALEGAQLFGYNPVFAEEPINVRNLIDAAMEAAGE
jgi:D-hexose-6-phosphate mutarotase